MRQSLKRVGQLRNFCAEMLPRVRDGRVAPDKAFAVAKLAGRINESFLAEATVEKQRREFGERANKLGDLPIGCDDARDDGDPKE